MNQPPNRAAADDQPRVIGTASIKCLCPDDCGNVVRDQPVELLLVPIWDKGPLGDDRFVRFAVAHAGGIPRGARDFALQVVAADGVTHTFPRLHWLQEDDAANYITVADDRGNHVYVTQGAPILPETEMGE